MLHRYVDFTQTLPPSIGTLKRCTQEWVSHGPGCFCVEFTDSAERVWSGKNGQVQHLQFPCALGEEMSKKCDKSIWAGWVPNCHSALVFPLEVHLSKCSFWIPNLLYTKQITAVSNQLTLPLYQLDKIRASSFLWGQHIFNHDQQYVPRIMVNSPIIHQLPIQYE